MKFLPRSSVAALLLMLLASACGTRDTGAPPNSVSPSARKGTDSNLREDLLTPRHPADGGGTAWLAGDGDEPPSAVAGGRGRFPLVYEAGPLGVAEGGAVYLLVSPFWDWSEPQVTDPERAGYTSLSSDAEGVVLDPLPIDSHLLMIGIGGRALAAGEHIRIVYGDGPAGALVDRFAEADSRLWLAVDGDGDGVRGLVVPSPGVTVRAGPAARLVLTLPSVARPGAGITLTLALLDHAANAWVDSVGTVELRADGCALQLPSAITLDPHDLGIAHLPLVAPADGVCRISARLSGTPISASSNPLLVSAAGTRIQWADLHGHSALSDGSGTPEQYLRYARDVAALDVAALTDHDHWGVRFLDAAPDLWAEIVEQTRRFHEPGRFVSLLGYEWTSWLHGHRHVLFFGDEGEILSCLDDRYDTPPELWAALRGRDAMTFAHHSAGGPIATNWHDPPDPELEPCTEISSVHGSSEALDAPLPIYHAVPGNFVRDILDRGVRFGFVGSGDSHDGHPGLAHLGAPSGGLAAILSDELSRSAVKTTLHERRVYATNGPRIILRFAVNGRPMGSLLPAPKDGVAALYVHVVAVSALARVELIRSGEVYASRNAGGELELELNASVDGVKPGEYLYLRAVQEDQGAAWSSPVFFE